MNFHFSLVANYNSSQPPLKLRGGETRFKSFLREEREESCQKETRPEHRRRAGFVFERRPRFGSQTPKQ